MLPVATHHCVRVAADGRREVLGFQVGDSGGCQRSLQHGDGCGGWQLGEDFGWAPVIEDRKVLRVL
jgi:hypothetical protein